MARLLPWLGAAALCLAFAWALLLPVVLSGQVAAIGDGLAQDWPMRLLAAREWHAGHLPLWNPFHFGGAPLWAAIQPGVLFPGNLPFLFLNPAAAWHWALALAYATAGLGAIALGRAHGLPWLAACVAGLAFQASGFWLGHVENLVMLQAAGFLPWLLAAMARMARALSWSQRGPWVLALAFAAALAVLAGHPQMAVFTALWGGLFGLAHLWVLPAAQRLPFGLALLAGGALGAMFSAPAWLPALFWLPHTSRAEIPYQQLAFRALPWRQVLTLWLPFAMGSPAGGVLAPYWGAPAFAELQGYVGLGPWAFAALALSAGRRRLALAFAGMAGLGLLLAMGPATPLFRAWAALPLLKSLPVPGRHLLVFDLGLAMLAGLGLARVQAGWASWPSPRKALLGAMATLGLPVVGSLVVLALWGPALALRWGAYLPGFPLAEALRPSAWAFVGPMALVLAWWALGLLWWWRLPAATSGPWARGPASGGLLLPFSILAVACLLALDWVGFARGQGWPQRSVPSDFVAGPWPPAPSQGRVLAVSAQRPYPFNSPRALHELAYPGWGALAGVSAVQGYDAFVGRRYAALAGRMEGAGAFSELALLGERHRFLDLAGVRAFWLEPGAAPAYQAALAPERWRPMPAGPGRLVWQNRRAFPRAWRVASVAAWPAAEVDLAVQGQRAWSPRNLALVDQEEGEALPELWASGSAEASFPVGASFELRSQGAGPGFVVLSEAYHPGWQAEVLAGPPGGPKPGSLLPLRRTNGWQMGVALPAGEWRVRLRYWPPGLSLAFGLAALAALLTLGFLLAAGRLSRRLRPGQAARRATP